MRPPGTTQEGFLLRAAEGLDQRLHARAINALYGLACRSIIHGRRAPEMRRPHYLAATKLGWQPAKWRHSR